ncbi:E3 ubiquitin-protein ligase UPL6 isoform X1 [Triticum aestivum]|uniref:E3 ubiquitin-protein ligase UPL6 isoform X1 n=1 Tax=Triticum aestivum TaxID=4565 RepID=UPI001D006075|nr:E3 ubiquitin-protein ligase UPL6-like isoform X1 [Triticum aestivum]
MICRIKRLALICVHTVHQKRVEWGHQVLMPSEITDAPSIRILETLACLLNPQLKWNCEVVMYLQQKKIHCLFREVIETVSEKAIHLAKQSDSASAFEKVLILFVSHVENHTHCCPAVHPRWSFPYQILSIPFLWHRLPHLKLAFCSQGLIEHYINKIASFCLSDVFPSDMSAGHPGYASLFANIFDAAVYILSDQALSHERVADLLNASVLFLDALPKIASPSKSIDDVDNSGLHEYLQREIRLVLQVLVNAAVRCTASISYIDTARQPTVAMKAVGSLSALVHLMLETFSMDVIMTALAFHTEIASVLWNFIKWCHESESWNIFLNSLISWPTNAPAWFLPVSLFCPIYMHMLGVLDNTEFIEQGEPFLLDDLKYLVSVLKEELFEILWNIPSHTSNIQAALPNPLGLQKISIEGLKSKAMFGLIELLSELQDWNNRLFTDDESAFCIDNFSEVVGEDFVGQAILANSQESKLVKIAPFLVPFSLRLQIYHLYLAADKAKFKASRLPLGSHPIEIRRTHSREDAFEHLNHLSSEELKGYIEVSFINQHGIREEGVGEGISRDFIDGVAKLAFGSDAGFFKSTSRNLLYPRLGSVSAQDLEHFHFLGLLLGKAMYENVSIEAVFELSFLKTIKQRPICLNDFSLLDKAIYNQLRNMKKEEDSISGWGLYFSISSGNNNDEEDLLPGGSNMLVTKHNFALYMHLVADYKLKHQIRAQSKHFLRGFQQLISLEWLDMFSEPEVQWIISGPSKGLDIDDLRSNTNYAGAFHQDHEVIIFFWEVLETFGQDDRKAFLKFVTGCSRIPIGGCQLLQPKFCIASLGEAPDPDAFPRSSTCFNQLKLPIYTTKEQLSEKLLLALASGAGFDHE